MEVSVVSLLLELNISLGFFSNDTVCVGKIVDIDGFWCWLVSDCTIDLASFNGTEPGLKVISLKECPMVISRVSLVQSFPITGENSEADRNDNAETLSVCNVGNFSPTDCDGAGSSFSCVNWIGFLEVCFVDVSWMPAEYTIQTEEQWSATVSY